MAADLCILIRMDYSTTCDLAQIEEECDVFLHFHNDFCAAVLGARYRDILHDNNGCFYMREQAHKVARFFGQTEVWYTSDMALDEEPMLDELISKMKQEGDYAEFNPAELLKLPCAERPLYGLYHDKFE